MKISNGSFTYNNCYFKHRKNNASNVSFSGTFLESKFFEPIKKPLNKFSDRVATGIAHGLTKVFALKSVSSLIEKTKKTNLVQGLTILTSLVLSGFYIQQTLKNKNLDSEKRKTLAINQGLTCIMSTLGALILDKKTDKFIEKRFSDKYSAVCAGRNKEEAIKLFHGINAAKSMIIFGFIYRFLAPVAVTPLANHIGNKLHERQIRESAAEKQPLSKTA